MAPGTSSTDAYGRVAFDLPLVGINREHGETLTLVGTQGAIAKLIPVARGADDGDDFGHGDCSRE